MGKLDSVYLNCSINRPEEGVVTTAGKGPDLDTVPPGSQLLGKGEGVDDSAPRFRGVSQQSDVLCCI